MKNSLEIISSIKSFHPKDGNWLELDDLIDQLWTLDKPEVGINVLFNLFEKYNKSDGEGVFWSILHGLETLDYEEQLYQSLLYKPSFMGIIMLNRIENSGSELIADKSIADLKVHIKNNPEVDQELLAEL
ncbi:hypothetical protein [Flammeovirga sp. SJP92]|uniref:hypothetical protein n=1 Tax=Flammeovirga sp. SJP92 TaxID=1775430 RepID=UPI000788E74C|nr:hypothetical protein [Flammeovirga sp. SJP92]KXX71840.1 hypothetical protein AVL50_03385 [Flammeovirga sp. SJP92]